VQIASYEGGMSIDYFKAKDLPVWELCVIIKELSDIQQRKSNIAERARKK